MMRQLHSIKLLVRLIRNKQVLIGFIALSAAASVLNYITYPILAHILPSYQFINITVALSLLTQISTFLSSIVAITIGLSKQKNAVEATKTIETLQAMLLQFFVLLTFLFLLSAPFIFRKLQLPIIYIVPVCLLMLFSIPSAIISGFFNGKNLLIKLGVTTLMAASLQFILTVIFGLSTKQGIWALSAMAGGQLLAIIVIYRVFKSEKLPKITMLSKVRQSLKTKTFRNLAIYTIASSIGIMAINIVQIVDLLIIKSRGTSDVKLYTDLYIVSRVVFFVGTVFIWPFLGSLNIHNPKENKHALLKLIGVFVIISASAATIIFFGGSQMTRLLFGSTYALSDVRLIGVLAILYKCVFLIVTSLTLYFIVLRSYAAVIVPIILTLSVWAYSLSITPNTTTTSIVMVLNLLGFCSLALYAPWLIVSHRSKKPSLF